MESPKIKDIELRRGVRATIASWYFLLPKQSQRVDGSDILHLASTLYLYKAEASLEKRN
ncbi:MAG: hypothetical protein PUP93_27000 [Rhizonema sp. NSF051]|nr:hypothetical protein [Rhizonema sp. NSF051]